MTIPRCEDFAALARSHPVVPVYRELLADQETPVSVFRRLATTGDAALLESVGGGETWGRFSTIALDPTGVFEARGTKITLRIGERVEERTAENPFAELETLVREHRTAEVAGVPRMAGGAIGFAAYDLVRRFERLPETAQDDLGLPDLRFVFFQTGVLFDHQHHTLRVVVNARIDGDPALAYARATDRIDAIERRLAEPAAHIPIELSDPDEPSAAVSPQFASTMSRAEFVSAVEKAKEYVRSGHIVQVVLAQRLEAALQADPFDVYRALRVINPSPYMFFLRTDGVSIAGASPEVLVRRQGSRVEVRPIAGTRRRGRDEAEDLRLERDLLGSEKERAEHVMLVDLGRNDVGRVARFGTVKVSEFQVVERYSHVMHLVSHVAGEIDPECRNAEVLAACFPAGTVSGAPKVRAMEIIEELEPVRRGLYAGAVGYLDFHGNMDTCIAIRTLVLRDGKAYLGAGAGIVADSDPEAEYVETMSKASALIRACELAARGLKRFSREELGQRQREVPRKSADEPGAPVSPRGTA